MVVGVFGVWCWVDVGIVVMDYGIDGWIVLFEEFVSGMFDVGDYEIVLNVECYV